MIALITMGIIAPKIAGGRLGRFKRIIEGNIQSKESLLKGIDDPMAHIVKEAQAVPNAISAEDLGLVAEVA